MRLVPIDGCYVTGSSGCHRYEYWNEQALFDPRPDNGWSTPSRTAAQREYLEIDLGQESRLACIRMQARPAGNHPGFPQAVRLLARGAADWQPMLDAGNVSAGPGEWWEAGLHPFPARLVRLEFDEVGWRPNGTYFLQIMQLQLLEETSR